MKKTISASLLLAAATTFATVPVTFTAGNPAKADEVNKNFASLDSAIQKKADASAVAALQTTVASKADASALKGIPTSDSLAAIRSSLAQKADQSTTTSLQSAVSGLQSSKADTADLRRVRDTVRTKIDSNWVKNAITKSQPTGTLLASNNLKDLTNPDIARKNLGLGSLAKKDTLTAADVGAIPAANASNFVTSNGGTAAYFPIFSTTNAVKTSKVCYKDAYSILSVRDTAWNQCGFSMDNPINGHAWQIGTNWSSETLTFAVANPSWQSPALILSGTDATIGKDLAVNGNLTVAGVIHASSGTILVPDYVFEPSYKLTTLSEVEAYTKEHKHLPEVPSATEIEKGGLDLAQMNLTLLKKVEELTLHAIAQQKEIADLKTSVQELRSR